MGKLSDIWRERPPHLLWNAGIVSVVSTDDSVSTVLLAVRCRGERHFPHEAYAGLRQNPRNPLRAAGTASEHGSFRV